MQCMYRESWNINCTLVDNKFVDHPDVFVASLVGVAPTTSLLTLNIQWNGQGNLPDERGNI